MLRSRSSGFCIIAARTKPVASTRVVAFTRTILFSTVSKKHAISCSRSARNNESDIAGNVFWANRFQAWAKVENSMVWLSENCSNSQAQTTGVCSIQSHNTLASYIFTCFQSVCSASHVVIVCGYAHTLGVTRQKFVSSILLPNGFCVRFW